MGGRMAMGKDWLRRKRKWSKGLVGLVIVALIIFVYKVVWDREEEKESWSWTIGNQIIFLDAGHGGVDPGAVGKISLEKDITLNITKHLQLLISQAGGKSIMVREADVDLGTSQGLARRKREDLAQRIKLAKEAQADVYLSIHVNSSPNSSLTGPQVFYLKGSPEGKMLAESIQAELNKVAGTKRVAKFDEELYILKNAKQVVVTVEVGFLSNPQEEKILNDPDYQHRLSVAIYQGLSDFLQRMQKAEIPQ